ncbi:thioesterase family protein [Maricurvus nonylphenolicus]|uniref:thioesterase family protein n=1 Tax=Maricurvus nonylphenolicus TaxID=1008307 RepID=UPI0036F2E88F
MAFFDQDLTVSSSAENGELSFPSADRWCWAGVPNGGFLLSMAAKAMANQLPHKDPVSVSATFVSRTELAPVQANVELLGQSKNLSQASVQLVQEGQVRVQAMGVFADLASRKGVDFCDVAMPNIPSPEGCNRVTYPQSTFPDNVDILLTPASERAGDNADGKEAVVEGWIKFSDDRDPDLLALLTFADSFPRAMEMVVGTQGWIPTLDYQVQCFAKPAPGYIACRFTTKRMSLGLLEETGELWDSEGTLVAVCRQSASVRFNEQEEARVCALMG